MGQVITRCVDCDPASKRPAPHPGPRCATHHRATLKARRVRAHGTRVQRVYGLTPGDYEALYEAQGGRCAICQRATGASKRLAVDHEHRLGFTRSATRGLLCSTCNQLLGWFRDDPELLIRAGLYLVNPPARPVLEHRGIPEQRSSGNLTP